MYTIIDVETTGNGLKGNKITEISIFKFDGSAIVEEFTSLVNPEQPIPQYITALTGIDDQMVAHAPTFSEIAEDILRITQDAIFVAHAVNFDYGVIKEEFKQTNTNFVRKKLCTVRLSRKLIPGLNSYSLGKLCTSLNIPLKNRHRARGDAHATVLLFKMLLAKKQSDTVIKSFLNSRSQEATLPPLLDRKTVDNLPNQPGIYYFLDRTNKIIYVGKAKQLKKRVLGHFYDKSEHEIQLCKEIAHVEFELSGSELLALLMESAAIKKHFPKFNRAQKKVIKQYGIFSYEDRNGIKHLAFGALKQIPNAFTTVNNPTESRLLLEEICKQFQLCPKYCQLRNGTLNCDEIPYTHCKGICNNNEEIQAYNLRVDSAINFLKERRQTLLLSLPGRTAEENAFIYMNQGHYKGYGFVSRETTVNSEMDLEAFLIPQPNTVEARQIINAHLNKIKISI
ncbi:DNA polymerase III subunit epsilon [Croceivirga radicis]|uniref:DNA polymerase III subunit epsilon n=1 Tax=Croceivirga radicis TaxID=1929488 RepID=A0A1V6LQB4_9FLAO|nr:exonuclease domain-containing protein [Croceivirga radicis]OQD42156.1 DNA polymerase III subunit epsilon [Croceivirga radicis]